MLDPQVQIHIIDVAKEWGFKFGKANLEDKLKAFERVYTAIALTVNPEKSVVPPKPKDINTK
ncbi:hypothetical protein ACFLXK_05005 [Chloroflexota bacterium]